MDGFPQIVLNSRTAKRFDGRHPWVMERSLVAPAAEISPGSVVDLVHPTGQWIGRGIYNPHSKIRIRVYQWGQSEPLDESWILARLDAAFQLRQRWIDCDGPCDALRVINSEGDGLSGLIIDKFAEYVVIQVTALAMESFVPAIAQWVEQNLAPKGVLLRVDQATADREGIEGREEWQAGEETDSPVLIDERGVKLAINVAAGQKTGYYLDQRANRRRVGQWATTGRVLDVCCYHGGFSLAIRAAGNEDPITAVDSSRAALEHAERNAQINGFPELDLVQADCFDYLEHLVSEREQFSTVILDPPRMASNRAQLQSALRAYHRLNLAAVQVLRPGGTLVTCSCSGRVSRSDLSGVLSSVAKRAKRRIQVLEARGADVDHPIDVNCPESEYLKCLICRVQ